MMERWSSNLGFILAAVGSAVGIGNIWRFSSVVGQNGGGAYLVAYFLAVLCFAVPLMILEMAVGRHLRSSVVSSFALAGEKLKIFGWLICLIVLLILSYYLVIMGWTLAYLTFSLLGRDIAFSAFASSMQPVAFFLISALATGIIVSLGVREGIERIVSYLIPLAFAILVVLVIFCLSHPGFRPGMEFFLRPDFSALSRPGLWSAAFGQAFFSLSVGMGILITYGAYMPEETDITKSAFIITISDITAALLAGTAIFSLVFTFGLQPTAGAELAFTTLPKAFELMPYGSFFSIAFFALLFSAALTSAISMMEVNVASIIGETGMTRRKASLILTIILIITGLAPALSYSQVDLRFQGLQILDLMDETVGTMGLPIAAFLVALIFKWFMKYDVQEGMTGTSEVWQMTLNVLTKYAIPAVLLIITISTLIGL